jgi:purine-nucleoside phosphorylase
MTYDDLRQTAFAIAERSERGGHKAALVLGSGLGDYAASLPEAVEIPYEELPHFPVPEVEGHGGSLYSAEVDGRPILVFSGRVHTYEGWDLDDVVFGVRAAAIAGCHTVLLTNAAGGVGDGLEPGDLVAIKDHINLTGRNPLYGPNDDRLGPRFPDMTDLYSPEIRRMIEDVAGEIGMAYKEGVYAWFLGPSYETPAEVQMAKRLGADLVGMSTVPEAIALRHMGVRVAGISLVSNLAAGISEHPLSHEEVKATGAAAREKFTRLLDRLLPLLATP